MGYLEIAVESESQSPEQVERTLAQRPFVQNVLPFLTSLTFHSIVLIVGVLTYQSVKYIVVHTQVQVAPSQNTLADERLGVSQAFTGLGHDPNLETIQNRIANTESGWDPDFSKSRRSLETAAGEPTDDASAESIIGPAKGRLSGRGGSGASGEGGDLAAFGLTPRLGGIPTILDPRWHGTPAASVVFVCDASGSMLNKFSTLRRELSNAVRALRPTQSFDIVFFGDGNAFRALSPTLLVATPQNRLKVEDWLENVTPAGETNPLPALDLAFKQRPQLVYLLTDGDFPDNAAVLKRVRDLNRDRQTHVNTIAFVGEGDNDTDFQEVLKTIAKESGGTYKFVRENDLN